MMSSKRSPQVTAIAACYLLSAILFAISPSGHLHAIFLPLAGLFATIPLHAGLVFVPKPTAQLAAAFVTVAISVTFAAGIFHRQNWARVGIFLNTLVAWPVLLVALPMKALGIDSDNPPAHWWFELALAANCVLHTLAWRLLMNADVMKEFSLPATPAVARPV